MGAFWMVFALLFTMMQNISSDSSNAEEKLEEPPLTKSLGYAFRKGFFNTLVDAKMNKEYMFQYNDMLKASQEAFENFTSKKDDRRLRRVVGEHNYEMMKEAGVLDRRRNSRVLESAVGQRRVKTQAVRRQKLNSQGLKSHLEHSKQSNPDISDS